MKMIDGKLHRYAYLLVYGCQMNQSDAERMMGQLRTIGYERTESMEEADLILINTCCVRRRTASTARSARLSASSARPQS